jgi:hypothetical protein
MEQENTYPGHISRTLEEHSPLVVVIRCPHYELDYPLSCMWDTQSAVAQSPSRSLP